MAAANSDVLEEIAELQEEVSDYKPGSASSCPHRVDLPDHLFIGLFGRTGCGKTSLINSLKFAVDGKLKRSKWNQVASQGKAGGHTMFRKAADITKKIYVIDNRGLDNPDTEQAITELLAQLDGKRAYSERVEWQEDGNDRADDSSLDLNPAGDPIGCAVFVFSAGHDIDTNTNGLKEVVDFLHMHQGRYPVAVITHVDQANPIDVTNLKTVLETCGVSDIFEVANITKGKRSLDVEHQLSLLSFLARCMTDGDETLRFKYYQQKENKRRRDIEEEKIRKREAEQKLPVAVSDNRRERDISDMVIQMHLNMEKNMQYMREQHQQQQDQMRQQLMQSHAYPRGPQLVIHPSQPYVVERRSMCSIM